MGKKKSQARSAALAWWAENDPPTPRCDNCSRPFSRGEGFLCKSRTFGLCDLICEDCFNHNPYEPYILSKFTKEDQILQKNIDTDPMILEHQMQEVLISFGERDERPQYPIPLDSEFPPAEFECDRYFYIGEACLIGRQPLTAIAHLKQSLSAFAGKSIYPEFRLGVRLALIECLSQIKDWDSAAKIIKELLKENPNEDRALTLHARILVRQGNFIEAYQSAMEALQVNPECLEAACYLGFIGFMMGKASNDVDWMEKDIENLENAQRLYPVSLDLAFMVQQCKEELKAIRQSSLSEK